MGGGRRIEGGRNQWQAKVENCSSWRGGRERRVSRGGSIEQLEGGGGGGAVGGGSRQRWQKRVAGGGFRRDEWAGMPEGRMGQRVGEEELGGGRWRVKKRQR